MRSEKTKRIHKDAFRMMCEALLPIWGGLGISIVLTSVSGITPTFWTYVWWVSMLLGLPVFVFLLAWFFKSIK